MLWGDDHQGFGEAPALPLIIAGVSPHVLPRLDHAALCNLLRRLPPDELDEALRVKLFRAASLPNLVLFVACGEVALLAAQRKGLPLAGYAEVADLLSAARAVHGAYLLQEATLGLARRLPGFSARRRMSLPQAFGFLLTAAGLAAAGFLMPPQSFITLLSAVSGVFFWPLWRCGCFASCHRFRASAPPRHRFRTRRFLPTRFLCRCFVKPACCTSF